MTIALESESRILTRILVESLMAGTVDTLAAMRRDGLVASHFQHPAHAAIFAACLAAVDAHETPTPLVIIRRLDDLGLRSLLTSNGGVNYIFKLATAFDVSSRGVALFHCREVRDAHAHREAVRAHLQAINGLVS